ncbi:cupin domain-containing protein [Spirillospora sp. CA-255316]
MSASPTDHQWVRRVVTANTAEGTATIAADVRHRVERSGKDGPAAVDLWKTTLVDDELLAHGTMTTGTSSLLPPTEGSVFRLVHLPPDAAYMKTWDAQVTFQAMGHTTTDADHGGDRTPGMHTTDTLDYAIVVSGEIWLVVDDGETLLQQGDVVIQRRTNHAWSNRSNDTAVVAFVLLDGRRSDVQSSLAEIHGTDMESAR